MSQKYCHPNANASPHTKFQTGVIVRKIDLEGINRQKKIPSIQDAINDGIIILQLPSQVQDRDTIDEYPKPELTIRRKTPRIVHQVWLGPADIEPPFIGWLVSGGRR